MPVSKISAVAVNVLGALKSIANFQPNVPAMLFVSFVKMDTASTVIVGQTLMRLSIV